MRRINTLVIILGFAIGLVSLRTLGWSELSFVIMAFPAVYGLLHLLAPRADKKFWFTILVFVAAPMAGNAFFTLTKAFALSCIIALVPIAYALLHLIISWPKYLALLLLLDVFLLALFCYGAVHGKKYGDGKELMMGFVLPVLLVNTIAGCITLWQNAKAPKKTKTVNPKNSTAPPLPRGKKTLCLALAVLLLLGGGAYLYKTYKVSFLSQKEIKANPSLLNGSTLKGMELKGLVLKDITLTGTAFTDVELQNPEFENVTFVDVKFDEMDMRDMRFKNVRFTNCTFINAHMRGGEFIDVTFTGGIFSFRGDPKDYYGPSYIREVTFTNVVFDAVRINNFEMESVKGSITTKNLKNMQLGKHGLFISGSQLTLRVDNCEAIDFSFASLSRDSTAYVTNTTFKNSGFTGEKNKAIYFENCKLLDTSIIGGAETLVVKNSTVSASVKGKGTWYFEGCDFVPDSSRPKWGTVMKGDKESRCFLLGSGNKVPHLSILGGTVYAFNLSIEPLDLYTNLPNFPPKPATAVNLRNVTVHGGTFENFTMLSGQWENVTLYPEVKIGNTNFGDLKVHALSFPEGPPWRGEGKISLTQSAEPFDWPDVHVPTPAELGLKDSLK